MIYEHLKWNISGTNKFYSKYGRSVRLITFCSNIFQGSQLLLHRWADQVSTGIPGFQTWICLATEANQGFQADFLDHPDVTGSGDNLRNCSAAIQSGWKEQHQKLKEVFTFRSLITGCQKVQLGVMDLRLDHTFTDFLLMLLHLWFIITYSTFNDTSDWP